MMINDCIEFFHFVLKRQLKSVENVFVFLC